MHDDLYSSIQQELTFYVEIPIHVPHIYGFVLAIHFYVCIYPE